MTESGITREDIIHFLGQIDDHKIVEILAVKGTYPELEEAAEWLAREGGAMGEAGHPLSGNIAAIYDVIARDPEFPGEDEPHE